MIVNNSSKSVGSITIDRAGTIALRNSDIDEIVS